MDGSRVRIPADINVADRVLAGLTVRQLALVAPAVLMAVCLFWLLSPYLPVAAVAAVCVPVAGAGIAVALGRWGGLPADRYLAAAASYAREPKLYLPATDDSSVGGEAPAAGWLPDVDSARRAAAPARPLATSVDAAGVLDLGADGVAVLAEVDGVNLTLGSVAERAAKATAFARTLNALAGPLQITIRATPVRLAPHITRLRDQARILPDPALAAAAVDHANFLDELAAGRTLLARQILLTAREPLPAGVRGRGGVEAAAGRALRRLEEAAALLGLAGVTVRVLDAAAVSVLLAGLAQPGSPPSPDTVTATGPISGPPPSPSRDWWQDLSDPMPGVER
nr:MULTISPECIES: PrgI family protein [Pseudofrankia]